MSANGNACLYGLIAKFDDAESLLEAANKTREAGYKDVKAFTPYYVEGLNDTLGDRPNLLPWFVLIGLVVGALIGFALQFHTSVSGYPLNVGGRPLNSWPAFMLVTFEMAILGAALTAVGGMFFRTNLPLPYHPVFNAPGIEAATRNQFFLCVLTTDRRFNMQSTAEFLKSLEPLEVSEVPC